MIQFMSSGVLMLHHAAYQVKKTSIPVELLSRLSAFTVNDHPALIRLWTWRWCCTLR